MHDATARWMSRGIALLALGPLAAAAQARVRASDGSDATTLLTGESLFVGLFALGVVGACLILAAGISARLADRHEAVLNVGFVMGWVAWTQGRLGDVYRIAGDAGAGALVRLSVEGAVLAFAVVLALKAADRVSRRSREQEGLALGIDAWLGAVRTKSFVPVKLVSLAIGLACSYVFARFDLPGQAIGSAFLGGVGAGVFGTLVHQSVMKDAKPEQPGVTEWFLPILAGVLACAVVGPIVGLAMPGAGGLLKGVMAGSLPGWVAVTPAAWTTGALIGVPTGISFLQPKEAAQAAGIPGSVSPR